MSGLPRAIVSDEAQAKVRALRPPDSAGCRERSHAGRRVAMMQHSYAPPVWKKYNPKTGKWEGPPPGTNYGDWQGRTDTYPIHQARK